MKRNSVIAEQLEKPSRETLTVTQKYAELSQKSADLAKQIIKLIQNDTELLKMFLDFESVDNQCDQEYQSVCFCEGVRTGFKLCLDIFGI